MKASDLMTPDVAWIDSHAPIGEAARLLAAAPAGVRCLLVGRGDRPPIGIVTGVDILRAVLGAALTPRRVANRLAQDRPLGPDDLADATLFGELARASATDPVHAIMSSPVRCVRQEAPLGSVMDLMIGRRIESVPVTACGRVVGMIHRRALLGALDRLMSATASTREG